MVFIFTSQKIEIAKCANEPRLRGLFAEDALPKLYFEQKKFGALNIETIDDARSWHKILPLNGLNRIRARQKNFSGDRQEFKKVPRAVGKTESYSYRQFIGIGNLVNVYHGIIEPQHLIDPGRMALLRELYEE